MKAQRVSRGIALPFHDLGAEMGVGGQRHAPAALTPAKTRYPLYRRLDRPQGRSGRARKISPSPRFVLRAVQPVASRYTDWAIPTHITTAIWFPIFSPHIQKQEAWWLLSRTAETRSTELDEICDSSLRHQ